MKDLEQLRDSFGGQTTPCIYQALTDTSHFMAKGGDLIERAIENKYETLRDKILMDSIMLQVIYVVFYMIF